MVSILFELQAKNSNFLTEYSKNNKVDLTETFNKFKTKLADCGEDEPQSPSCGEQI